jgi:MFS superfamily sulfate permease-like transporter
VASAAGAHSQIANLVAAFLSFLTLLFLTPLFRNMPQPALAAIVIAAMLHLTKPSYLAHLFARSRWSFANTVIVIIGELTLGVLQGIALGVLLSLVTLIYLTTHPEGTELGQLPGTEAYRSIKRRSDALTFPGLLIWRIGGSLFFASIGHASAALKACLQDRSQVKRVLLDLASVDFIDISAGDELSSLIKELQGRGISVALVRVRDAVREDLRRAGVESLVGADNFYERMTDGVQAWQRQRSASG